MALLEIARVLDLARLRPPTDIYLVWFGCHERGMHGSPHFAATHQDVLDRALAIIELAAKRGDGRPNAAGQALATLIG